MKHGKSAVKWKKNFALSCIYGLFDGICAQVGSFLACNCCLLYIHRRACIMIYRISFGHSLIYLHNIADYVFYVALAFA